jgi:hypothetical protein
MQLLMYKMVHMPDDGSHGRRHPRVRVHIVCLMYVCRRIETHLAHAERFPSPSPHESTLTKISRMMFRKSDMCTRHYPTMSRRVVNLDKKFACTIM